MRNGSQSPHPPSAELADLAGGSLPARPWQVKAALGIGLLSLAVSLARFLFDRGSLGYWPGAIAEGAPC